MHRFKFRKGELFCENVPVRKIAKSVGTPCYVYSLGTFNDHFQKLKKAFEGIETIICFSVKSNSNLSVLKMLVDQGAGLDIVSGGELFKAKRVKADPKKIVFASVGKHEDEIRDAVKAGILLFNVESEAELEVINRVASQCGKVQNVALRINPDVQAKTHKYITTGTKDNKFGMDLETAFRIYTTAYRYPSLKFNGVHLHIGSQITESAPFVKAVTRASDFVNRLRLAGVYMEYLNIGGGLGIVYSKERPQTAAQFAKAIKPHLKKLNLKVILEPGRFISGNSGILVTSVLYWKESYHKKFAIVNAGMNDLLRPSIYSAYHEIVPVIQKSRGTGNKIKHVDVVGPICESGDFLGKDRLLPRLFPGDLLAVMSAGAYSFTMSSNYNSRPRIPEVVVAGTKFAVARRRETYDDLIKAEKIVSL
jgi:diaminopimelate decarboxylase